MMMCIHLPFIGINHIVFILVHIPPDSSSLSDVTHFTCLPPLPAAQVGDGDCGSTLALGARAILSDVKAKYNLNDAAATAWQLALSIRHAVGGTSGALYDVFATAAARKLQVISGGVRRDR